LLCNLFKELATAVEDDYSDCTAFSCNCRMTPWNLLPDEADLFPTTIDAFCGFIVS